MVAHNSWAKVYDRAYKESFGAFYKELTECTLEVIKEEFSECLKLLILGQAQEGYHYLYRSLAIRLVDASEEMLKELQKKDIEKK